MTTVKRPKRFGFFNLEKLRTQSLPGMPDIDADCDKCGLYKQVNSPKMPVTGKGRLKALILAEAPGETEDKENIQLIGKAGQLLRRHLRTLGLDLDRDFWKRNIVNCRPTTKDGKSNRPPTKKEVQYCRPKWKQTIAELNPQFIILAGSKPIEAFFGDRKSKVFTKDLTIGRWRQLCIPDPIVNAWVLPILHPSFAQRSPDMEDIFHDDLKFATSVVKAQKPVPEFPDETKKITVIHTYDEILQLLEKANEQPYFAFDFETNCLKPHFAEAKLFTIGFAWDENSGFSFPFDHSSKWSDIQKRQIKKALWRVLENPEIHKIVQNRGMEEVWCLEKLNIRPYPISWDTMIASHVINERDYFTGLKFQAYINWGIIDYDKEVEPFKTSPPGELYNRFDKLPYPKICLYNGMDAMLTLRLSNLQRKSTRDPSTKRANEFLQGGMEDLVKMTFRGIDVNRKYYEKVTYGLKKKIKTLKQEIDASPEAKLFKQKTGNDLDIDSTDHLKKLLFDFMELKPISYTPKGIQLDQLIPKYAQVNADVLERLDLPFTKNIVKIRRTKKIADYTGLIHRLSDGDKIHPSFNLHTATTYRSSSDNPNLQNFPKRDKIANKIVRMGIIPTPGWQFLAADFGAMEVRGFAWYSKDPVLVKELTEGMDPHGVWAEFLGCSRFDAKNAFVFPLIYGSYWKSIIQELRYRGYKNISEELVRLAEDKFWEKYNYAKEWQNRLIYDYYKKGYVETYLGFRRRGVLRKNQIVNFPIQSTCFHCLIWSYRRLSEIQFLEEWKTTQCGQIHDENLFKLWPLELAHVGRTIERVMVDELMARYEWINVPPIAEFAVSKIGGSWAQMYQFTEEETKEGKTKIKNDWNSVEGKAWEDGKLIVPEEGIVRRDGTRQFERGKDRPKK